MDKNIWILHHYATPPSMSGLTRPYEFSKQLMKHRYNVTIFSSAYLHYTGENLISDKNKYIIDSYEGIPFIFVRSPIYKNNGISRVRNMLAFLLNILSVSKPILKTVGKPDIIYASSPHPLTLLAGIMIGKRLKIPCICEVRDLWPESFVAYGIIKKNNPILRLLYTGEKWIYKNADKLIFTMEGGRDYITEQGWDEDNGGPIDINKVHHINNGVDLDVFNYNNEHYQINDEDLDNPNIFKVVYTGSIRLVNKVEILVDVAKRLKNTKVKFLIWGDGDRVELIKQKIHEEKLSNIVLKGRVNKKYIPNILSKADLNIILGETSKLYRFGLSPNKLFEYFAAGKPVLQTFKANYSIVEKNGVGVELIESTSITIAESVKLFHQLDESKYRDFCEKSLTLSKEYDFKKLTNKLIEVIEK